MIEQQSEGQAIGTIPAPAIGQEAATASAAFLARSKAKPKLRSYERTFLWVSRIIIWFTLILVIFPVLMVVVASFSAGSAFYSSSLLPETFTLDHYRNVLNPDINQF